MHICAFAICVLFEQVKSSSTLCDCANRQGRRLRSLNLVEQKSDQFVQCSMQELEDS